MAPRTRPHRPAFDDVMADVVAVLSRLAERAAAVGVRRESILVDPGCDMGKNTRHSLEAVRRLDELVATGWPVLAALSRKDFVGETLDLPADQRLTGTLATTAVSAWLGARVFRAHDVAATRLTLDMVASIRGTRQPAACVRGLA
jgi:dihydropteroate synthase